MVVGSQIAAMLQQDFEGHSQKTHYNFNYAVEDDHFSVNFGQQKSRDGENTQGSYYVHLPDGRLQKVTYHVDGDSGFVAEVTYEGEAREHVPKKLKESRVPSRTRSRNHEYEDSKESYVPARTSYRSRQSKKSRESYSHTSVSQYSLQSEESQEAVVAKDLKPSFVYRNPSPPPGPAHVQAPVFTKPSRRLSKHSSEESQTYSPSKSSLVSGRPLRPKTLDSEEEERHEIPHSDRSFSSSSEVKNRREGLQETSLSAAPHAPQNYYDIPVYVPQSTRSQRNSYMPEDLLSKDFA